MTGPPKDASKALAPGGGLHRGRTLDERRRERRTGLLDAALELFGTQGYASSPIEQLCRTSFVTTRYFYEEFGTKEELLISLYERECITVTQTVRAAVDAATGTDRAARTAIGTATLIEATMSDPRVARVLLLESGSIAVDHEPRRLAAQQALAGVLAELWRGRRAASPTATTLMGLSISGAITEVLTDWLLAPETGRTPLDEVTRIVTDVLVTVGQARPSRKKARGRGARPAWVPPSTNEPLRDVGRPGSRADGETSRRYGGAPLAERRRQRRQALLEAALELYGTKGYANTSTTDLFRASGVNSRYFYEEFGSREDLLLSLYDSLLDRVARDVFDVVDPEVAEGPGYIEWASRLRLEAFAHAVLDDERVARIAFVENGAGSYEFELRRRRNHLLYAEFIADLSTKYVVSGEITEQNWRVIGLTLVGATTATMTDWVLRPPADRLPIDDLVDHLLGLLLAVRHSLETGATA